MEVAGVLERLKPPAPLVAFICPKQLARARHFDPRRPLAWQCFHRRHLWAALKMHRDVFDGVRTTRILAEQVPQRQEGGQDVFSLVVNPAQCDQWSQIPASFGCNGVTKPRTGHARPQLEYSHHSFWRPGGTLPDLSTGLRRRIQMDR